MHIFNDRGGVIWVHKTIFFWKQFFIGKLNSARIVQPLKRKPKLLKNWKTRERFKPNNHTKSNKDTNPSTRAHMQ